MRNATGDALPLAGATARLQCEWPGARVHVLSHTQAAAPLVHGPRVAAEVLNPAGRAVLMVAEGTLPAPPPALE
ncbi:MAG: hypothetical protein ACRDJN_25565, partial [Chloroflexota bacterium]